MREGKSFTKRQVQGQLPPVSVTWKNLLYFLHLPITEREKDQAFMFFLRIRQKECQVIAVVSVKDICDFNCQLLLLITQIQNITVNFSRKN